jgi:iron complex outermembrane receptor protein
MALRLAFANDYADSYFEDGTESTDTYAARARLLIEPTETFNLIATFEWSDVDGGGSGLSYCPPWAVSQAPTCENVEWKPYQGFGLPGNYVMNGTDGPIGESPGFNKRTNFSAILEFNYFFEAMTFTSISNYHYYDRIDLLVWDAVSYSPSHQNDFVTQEFRLASTGDTSFDWVAGVFYSRENSDGVEKFGTQLAPDYQVFEAASSYGVENGVVTSSAVFGEVTYPVSDRFRLRGGLRFTSEEKDLPGTARANLNTPDPVVVQTGDILKTDKVTWLVGAEYRF